jgi:peptidoglycan-associated lipoprotein
LSRTLKVTPPIQVQAFGKDETKSEIRVAEYIGIPEIALVVNFDTARYNIDAQDQALIKGFARDVLKYGYKEVDITGHTDSRGGIDNNILSKNRASAARDYLLKLVPDLKVTVNGYADAISVASNATAEGRAENRRSAFRVVK